jgi:hypothetical protein
MSFELLTGAIVLLAAALALWGSVRRARSWTRPLVWAQLLLAAIFYFLLFPPRTVVREDTLTILTPGASAEQLRRLPRATRVAALPDAPRTRTAIELPDVAAALRAFPDVRNLIIVGGGLPARDQDAVSGLGLGFEPAPLHGLVELVSPQTVPLGGVWTLSGRVAAPAASVELLDPSSAVIDTAKPDRDGRFTFSAQARGVGPARFEVHVLDEHRHILDSAAAPIVVRAGESLTIIVRAGAPDAELKYFRRWAVDAGLEVRSSAGLSTAVTLHDGDTRLTPEALAHTDLVIVDERGWLALDGDEKEALRVAVEDGLGLLLRVKGQVDVAVSGEWSGYGYRVSPLDTPQSVTLDQRFLTHDRSAFTAAPVSVQTQGAVEMLETDEGNALAWWRAQGRGRVGLWALTDTYRLLLLGDAARYGTLWADSIATLARPRATAREPHVPDLAWLDERAVVCGLSETAQAIAPDGAAVALIVDRQGCAGYWPTSSGWHEVESGGRSGVFYVRATGDGDGLRAARDQRATQRLQHHETSASPQTLHRAMPMSRWPLFGLWVVLTGMIWWRERTH